MRTMTMVAALFAIGWLAACGQAETAGKPNPDSAGQAETDKQGKDVKVYPYDGLVDGWSIVIGNMEQVDVRKIIEGVDPVKLKKINGIGIYNSKNIDLDALRDYPFIRYLTISNCPLSKLPDLTMTNLEQITLFGVGIDTYDVVFYPPTLNWLEISETYKKDITGLREIKNAKVLAIGLVMTSDANKETIEILIKNNPEARLDYNMYIRTE